MKVTHWLIRDRGADLRIEVGFVAGGDRTVSAATRSEVDALLWRGLHTGDPQVRRVLEAAYRALRGTPAPGGGPSDHAPDFERSLAHDLRFAATSGWLRITRTEPARGGGGAVAAPPVELPALGLEPKPDAWIAIELLDDDDNPVPDVGYRIECSDGRVRTGTTDRSGKAREDGLQPGTCEVSFPALNGPDWRQAG